MLMLQDVLGEVLLIGGLLGDGLVFCEIFVFYDGWFCKDVVVVVILLLLWWMKVFCVQYYGLGDIKMVIIVVDLVMWIVYEINVEFVVEEYVWLIGIIVKDFSFSYFVVYLLMVCVGGEYFV